MTTAEDIQKQINKDYSEFYAKIYDGFVPNELLEKFKVALMMIPPAQFSASAKVLKQVIAKRQSDLSFLDIGIIINTLRNVPLEVNFFNLDDGLDYYEEFEKIQIEYNDKVKKLQDTLERKQARLLSLSGLSGGTIPMPGTNHKK